MCCGKHYLHKNYYFKIKIKRTCLFSSFSVVKSSFRTLILLLPYGWKRFRVLWWTEREHLLNTLTVREYELKSHVKTHGIGQIIWVFTHNSGYTFKNKKNTQYTECSEIIAWLKIEKNLNSKTYTLRVCLTIKQVGLKR